jgi:hypothetical protein
MRLRFVFPRGGTVARGREDVLARIRVANCFDDERSCVTIPPDAKRRLCHLRIGVARGENLQ